MSSLLDRRIRPYIEHKVSWRVDFMLQRNIGGGNIAHKPILRFYRGRIIHYNYER